ncbi:TRAP transporter small permease [Ancylobacter mangrovi]|uniref:TRAP transporter small permease protein n=1 Tax=Ancylobacter mangrovi TaxID=2972472 RepID=A0A9X2PEF8_9HYPH|nr:TRAP transporter small permease [Ancylobacter mangrovi]MCS0494475.1 TRAP transporter small permease [Ancylobacter mangrovi]MCS0500819.1 TRAP transporter small permease [Ancylobacter mangrovi]
MLALIHRVLDLLERALMTVAGCMLVVMLCSLTIDAAGRYLFHHPLPGNFEFTGYFSMVMLAFLALPRNYTTGGHIQLDVLKPWLRRVPLRLSERLNALLAAAAFGIVTWYAGIEALHKIEMRETTIGIVQMPVYISFICFPLGCLVLTLRLAVEIFFPEEHRQVEDIEL